MDYMEFHDIEHSNAADMDAVWRALASARGLNALRELHFSCDPTFSSYVAHVIGSPTLPPDLELHVSSFEVQSPVRVGDTSDVLLERFQRRFGEGPVEDANAWAEAIRYAHALDPAAYDAHWRPVVASLPRPDMLPTMYDVPDAILPPEVGMRARSDQRGSDALANNISRRATFHRLRALDLSDSEDAEGWLRAVVSDERMPRLHELRIKVQSNGEELFEEFARGGRHRPLEDLTHLELELTAAAAANLHIWLNEGSRIRLRHLTLDASGVKGSELVELLESPALSTLETLKLIDWRPNAASIVALTRLPCARQLRTLCIVPRSALGDDLARHIWESGRFEALEDLELWVENVDDASTVELGRTDGLPSLRRLSLGKTDVGDAGFVGLMGVDCSLRLEALACRASLGADAIERTRGCATWESLRALDVSYSTLSAGALETLLENLVRSPIEDLALSGIPFGDEGVEALCAILSHAPLTCLKLWKTGLTSRGVAALTRVPAFGALEELSLAYNPIGDRGLWELSRASHLRSLRRLDLRDTGFEERGARALARAPELVGLKTLRLGLKRDDARVEILNESKTFGKNITLDDAQNM